MICSIRNITKHTKFRRWKLQTLLTKEIFLKNSRENVNSSLYEVISQAPGPRPVEEGIDRICIAIGRAAPLWVQYVMYLSNKREIVIYIECTKDGRRRKEPPRALPPLPLPPHNPCLLVRKRRIIFQPLLIPLRIPLWILWPAAKQYRQRFVRLIDRLFISLCAPATDDVSILNAVFVYDGRFVSIFERKERDSSAYLIEIVLKQLYIAYLAGLIVYWDICHESSSSSLMEENVFDGKWASRGLVDKATDLGF